MSGLNVLEIIVESLFCVSEWLKKWKIIYNNFCYFVWHNVVFGRPLFKCISFENFTVTNIYTLFLWQSDCECKLHQCGGGFREKGKTAFVEHYFTFITFVCHTALASYNKRKADTEFTLVSFPFILFQKLLKLAIYTHLNFLFWEILTKHMKHKIICDFNICLITRFMFSNCMGDNSYLL